MFEFCPEVKVRRHVCNYDVTAATAKNPRYITVTVCGINEGVSYERSFNIVNDEQARELIERRLGWLVVELMRRY